MDTNDRYFSTKTNPIRRVIFGCILLAVGLGPGVIISLVYIAKAPAAFFVMLPLTAAAYAFIIPFAKKQALAVEPRERYVEPVFRALRVFFVSRYLSSQSQKRGNSAIVVSDRLEALAGVERGEDVRHSDEYPQPLFAVFLRQLVSKMV